MSIWFVVLSTLVSLVVGYLRWRYTYWESRGVKQLKTNFLFGNLFSLKSIHLSELTHEVYQAFKGEAKVAGAYIFTRPVAVLLDLDLVKSVLIRDFNKFADRTQYRNKNDPLSQHLFLVNSTIWRPLRTKLTPTFTSGKMKFMFPTIVRVAKEFEAEFKSQLEKAPDGCVEMYDMNARFTTDVIGTCAFGVECNSLRDPNVEFRQMGRRIFAQRTFSIRFRLFLSTYANLLKFFGLKRFSPRLELFFMRIVRDTVLERERHNIRRNDFVDLLIELKNTKDENGRPCLTHDLLAAQLFVFFAAGFETSSGNMSYGLFELAKNPQKQEKLRSEILEVLDKYNGELTYEAMMEMSYLDQVVSETLRMYPALSNLTRIALEDYKVPDTDIVLEKGTQVLVPAKEIHYDPDIYEEPHQFRPERFHPSEVQMRHPQSFLGFGDGPRNCIGLRFGRMQVRIGLITLLKSYRFHLSERNPNELKISKYGFVLVPENGVWLKVEKLSFSSNNEHVS